MKSEPVILIFDVGKTNKKILLFDKTYRLLHEESIQVDEVVDEDGFPCDNLAVITQWVRQSFNRLVSDSSFDVRAVNFSAYGASFVYVDENLNPLLPLYNYLKPYPKSLLEEFYNTYGGEAVFARTTASPVLGSLNSGMQLYRLKQEQPEAFKKIRYALHLPQYLSSILSGKACSEITSIGCHTNLWDFTRNDYHDWVIKEDLATKLPPIVASDECVQVKSQGRTLCVGVGLHDSSAALIPYLSSFHEPFILLSTGTWCISLNPFNHSELSNTELEKDCLCYLTHKGDPVKASRLFAGHEHEQQTKRLAEYFKVPADYFTALDFDSTRSRKIPITANEEIIRQSSTVFAERKLSSYNSVEEAYQELIVEIVAKQLASTTLVLEGNDLKRIFVDGGFSKNRIYMNLMASSFPQMELFAASVAQASALGAALAMHKHWNERPLPSDLIELKFYSNVSVKES